MLKPIYGLKNTPPSLGQDVAPVVGSVVISSAVIRKTRIALCSYTWRGKGGWHFEESSRARMGSRGGQDASGVFNSKSACHGICSVY